MKIDGAKPIHYLYWSLPQTYYILFSVQMEQSQKISFWVQPDREFNSPRPVGSFLLTARGTQRPWCQAGVLPTGSAAPGAKSAAGALAGEFGVSGVKVVGAFFVGAAMKSS